MLCPELLDATLADAVSESDGPAAPRHHSIPEGMPVIVGVPRTSTNHHERLSRCTSEMSRRECAMPVPHPGHALTRVYAASLLGYTRKIGERGKSISYPRGTEPGQRATSPNLRRLETRKFSRRKTPRFLPTRLGAGVATRERRRRSVEAAALCADVGGSTPPAGSILASDSLFRPRLISAESPLPPGRVQMGDGSRSACGAALRGGATRGGIGAGGAGRCRSPVVLFVRRAQTLVPRS